MTVMEAINHIDSVKPNDYTQREKIRWLSVLDSTIKKEVIEAHEGDGVHFSNYTETSLMTKLLVDEPYDDIYIKWLEAQIDYANGEYDKYNNTAAAYNEAYIRYVRSYTRNHKPINTANFKGF